jgi:sortase A
MLLRDLVGYALVCSGGACVALAGSRYAIGEMRQEAARRAWDAQRAQAVVASARRSVEHSRGVEQVASGVPVARITIPRLRLDEIVVEGVGDNSLNAGPGHVPGSAFPGQRGNSVISAHRDRHFARLGDIRIGDTVVTESGARTDTWVVTSRRIVAASEPALFRTTDETLTLTTCWPIRYFGTAPERLIVTGKLTPTATGSTGTTAATGSTD